MYNCKYTSPIYLSMYLYDSLWNPKYFVHLKTFKEEAFGCLEGHGLHLRLPKGSRTQKSLGAPLLKGSLLAKWGKSCPKALFALLTFSLLIKYRDDRAAGKEKQKTGFWCLTHCMSSGTALTLLLFIRAQLPTLTACQALCKSLCKHYFIWSLQPPSSGGAIIISILWIRKLNLRSVQ